MEAWRKVWREGFVQQLSALELESVRKGLRANDYCLVQGSTTVPPPMQVVLDCPIEATDILAYGAWKSGGLKTVGEAEEYVAKLCFQADTALGEPAAASYFLNWYDDTPREEMRIAMIAEINLALKCVGYKL